MIYIIKILIVSRLMRDKLNDFKKILQFRDILCNKNHQNEIQAGVDGVSIPVVAGVARSSRPGC